MVNEVSEFIPSNRVMPDVVYRAWKCALRRKQTHMGAQQRALQANQSALGWPGRHIKNTWMLRKSVEFLMNWREIETRTTL